MDANETRAIIITGGGTGMGRAIAQAFARLGDQVVILGRREDVLRDTAEALGPTVSWQRADVSRREDVESAVSAVVARHHQINVLVNAAGFANGVNAHTPLAEAERRWDDTVGANLKGAFLMSIAVAPHLARPGGRILNISSIAAYTGGSRGNSIEYAAAKAGMHGLTMGLARDLSGQGITVNVIAPGFITETEFTSGWSEERVRQIVAQTPAGRPGKPDDIAAAAVFLASSGASFINGEVLNVNGGWLFGR